jgi:hypothetical protein
MSTPHDLTYLEQSYDILALAIDRAGREKAELFLTKLGLLLAHELKDAGRFSALCEQALADL